MIKNSETFLKDLNDSFVNLTEIMKNEKDAKRLKELELELNKINNLIRILTNYINYYKIKELKSKP